MAAGLDRAGAELDPRPGLRRHGVIGGAEERVCATSIEGRITRCVPAVGRRGLAWGMALGIFFGLLVPLA